MTCHEIFFKDSFLLAWIGSPTHLLTHYHRWERKDTWPKVYLWVHKTLEEGGCDPNWNHEILFWIFEINHEAIRSHILMRIGTRRRWSSQFWIQSSMKNSIIKKMRLKPFDDASLAWFTNMLKKWIQSGGHGYKMFYQDAATLLWCGYKKMINNIVRIQATKQVWAPRSFP